jgi:hypothetical protein
LDHKLERSCIASFHNRRHIFGRKIELLVICFVLLSALACFSIETNSAADSPGRLPETAIEPGYFLNVSTYISVAVMGLQEGVELESTFQRPPEEGYHYALVNVSVACASGSGQSFCEIDSGDFTLFGDKAILYEERENMTNVPDHLGTIFPEGTFDVLGFDYGRTEIPSGRTRDAVLVFVTDQQDGNYVLSYRENYYWKVPEPTE